MGLTVKVLLGDDPSIEVKGTVIDTLRGDQLNEMLSGRPDLIDRVKKHHGWGNPDGVHLSDDDGLTGHLAGSFVRYGWKPATLVHRAKGARIIAATAEPQIVLSVPAVNSSDQPSHQSAEVTQDVTQAFSHEAHWDVSSSFTQTVTYEIGGEAAGGKVGGSSAFTVSAGYGESNSKSESVTLGAKAGVVADLAPGKAVVFDLSATRGRLEAQVDWERDIKGGVFVHYGKRKNGHYFWYIHLSDLYPKGSCTARSPRRSRSTPTGRNRPASGTRGRARFSDDVKLLLAALVLALALAACSGAVIADPQSAAPVVPEAPDVPMADGPPVGDPPRSPGGAPRPPATGPGPSTGQQPDQPITS